MMRFDLEADWVANGFFINASEPFEPSWVCILNYSLSFL